MAFFDREDLKNLYEDSIKEARIWRQDYPQYERLMNNDLMEGLDPNLPEVNDGSLAAALFKLPKRIVSSKLTGTAKAINRDEAWVSELATMIWQKDIVPYANTQAPFHRKWKDAVRKAAGYGSVPLITLFVESEGKRHADFIVGQPQDVSLEVGKVSDYDSDALIWEVYFTKTQWKTMIEQAKQENKDAKADKDSDDYNNWDIPAMEKILAGNYTEEREGVDTPLAQQTNGTKPKGIKCCVIAQRGEGAPFYMYHKASDSTVREWSNPDPTGDTMIHFLYCYQDFINPYGIGIVKLAGGTQNVLDYMRQADVLATQLGLRPPIQIAGDEDDVDLDSIVYAQDAFWFTGTTEIKRQELANGVYNEIPGRIQMYKTSLQQILPMGDTSATAADSGDPTQSKTPAGVKLQAANLSIDDEDFKDNLYMTYAAVAKSMINTHMANMEGTDLMKVSDDEREILMKAGLEFPQNANGEMSNQVEIIWDDMRSKFDFEVDPEVDKAKDDADKLEGLTKVAELAASDPTFNQDLADVNKKLNKGELYASMVGLTTDNDKIITDIAPDEQGSQLGPDGQPIPNQAVAPQTGQPAGPQSQPPKTPSESLNYKDAPEDIKRQIEAQAGLTPSQMTSPDQQKLDQAAGQQNHSQNMDIVNAVTPPAGQIKAPNDPNGQPPTTPAQTQPQPTPEEMKANVEAVMKQFGVDENTALAALAAEHAGFPPEDVINHLKQPQGVAQ